MELLWPSPITRPLQIAYMPRMCFEYRYASCHCSLLCDTYRSPQACLHGSIALLLDSARDTTHIAELLFGDSVIWTVMLPLMATNIADRVLNQQLSDVSCHQA